MFNYYNSDIIPIILNRFKVHNLVLKGILDNEVMDYILKYCENNDCVYNDILSQIELESSDLLNLNNYDAIFLNDDPNWYTVFNELKIIKESNEMFPLVFICNNIFPHKRRDSYSNPNIIPNDFINDYSKNLEYNNILLNDGLYHAIEENTSKNGVLTAIEDFLDDNNSIGVLDINFLNGMTILYPKNNISKIRLGLLFEEIDGHELEYDDLSDVIIENQILTSHIANFNIDDIDFDVLENFKVELGLKEKIIVDLEDKINIQSNELRLNDSKINNIASKLDLNETKFKNLESKLVNRDLKINELNDHLQHTNSEINNLKLDISQKEKKELELNNEIKDNLIQINNKNQEISSKNNQIRTKDYELLKKEKELCLFKHQYTNQLSKLDNKEYCISCYKEEINNNKLEIQYLKKDSLTRKLLSPLAYVYLIFKSNPKELSINFKLYKAIKNSKCFDIGYYLSNNKDIQESNWCKFFSPELHYVCRGFVENRKFNKKYFNRNSKKELLEYIINCP